MEWQQENCLLQRGWRALSAVLRSYEESYVMRSWAREGPRCVQIREPGKYDSGQRGSSHEGNVRWS